MVSFEEVFKIVKYILILIKCIAMIYKFLYCIVRYKRTYKIWNQFEILLFLVEIVIIVCILAFDFIAHSFILLYGVFWLNSLLNSCSSYVLMNKAIEALFSDSFKKR